MKEKLKPAQAIAIFVAFIGSLFIIKPTFTNMELFPSVIGLCGGIGAGIAYAMVRILGQRGQKGSSVVLFFSGFSCIVTLPYLLFNFHPMTGAQILALFGAGLADAGNLSETKSQSIMIGDRKDDILGAKASGIDSMGVRYGFAEEQELEMAGADYIVETVEDIRKKLNTL